MARAEINLTALFCGFCQAFTSYLLFQDFNKQEDAIQESAGLSKRSIILIKFVCAMLFHFKFETEIRSGLQMMKYAAMHSIKFENATMAFTMGLVNAAMTLFIEGINLWNLANIMEGGTHSLMFDFIALGIIAEFDDYFVEIYRNSTYEPLLELALDFESSSKPKREQPDLKDFKL